MKRYILPFATVLLLLNTFSPAALAAGSYHHDGKFYGDVLIPGEVVWEAWVYEFEVYGSGDLTATVTWEGGHDIDLTLSPSPDGGSIGLLPPDVSNMCGTYPGATDGPGSMETFAHTVDPGVYSVIVHLRETADPTDIVGGEIPYSLDVSFTGAAMQLTSGPGNYFFVASYGAVLC